MINLYEKYYLTDKKVQEILKNGIIVFDTSALLDLYYYSFETQNEIIDNVFQYLKGRLWMPSQVYFEYFKNKKTVAEKPISTYQSLIKQNSKDRNSGYIEKIVASSKELQNKRILEIKNQLKTLKEQTLEEKKHPHLNPNLYKNFEEKLAEYEVMTKKFIESTEIFEKLFSSEIENRIKEIEESILPDNILNAIQTHFQIGKEYSYERMFEISKEGEYRYLNQIPPGYEDGENKIGFQKYGDLFLWKQILDHFKKKQSDCILVTNDVKNDWFEIDKRTPRFELLKEFNAQSNKSIWLLSMKNFIWKINSLLDERLNTTILEDIDSIQETKKNDQDDIKISIDLLQDIFDNFLQGEMYLIDTISQNEAIRVFNNPQLFEAEDIAGNKHRIVATLLNGSNYARMLHGITNAFEIKKFYDFHKEHYTYYNFIIVKNKESLDKCLEHLNKNKVKKMFMNKSIFTLICYFEEDKLQIAKSNFIYH